MKALGYVRVSTGDQAREGVSLDAQEAAIRREAEARGLEVEAVYRDEGLSAKTLDRPGLMALLERVSRGGVGFVLVTKLDRLTRETSDAIGLDLTLRRARVSLVALDSGEVDTADPTGELLYTLRAALAKYERRLVSARTRFALQHKLARGEAVGRPARGLRIVDKRFVADPRSPGLKVARRARALRRKGLSYRAIAAALDAEGYRPERAAAFSGRAVWYIVRNGRLADAVA
jgi:DNA invertase Pin-like site-specific DNA recombinase